MESPDTHGLREARVLGVGAYRPERRVENADRGAESGVSDQWIRSRTGIVARGLAGPSEDLVSMAVSAGRRACEAAGVVPEAIGCVLLATMTQDRQVPPAAVEVAWRIGARSAAAYNVSAACSAFCCALGLARDHIRSGSAEYVLVIGADRMSDIVDPGDRDTGPVFGDGAGAVVAGAAGRPGIGPVAWGSDGSAAPLIRMSATWGDLVEDRSLRRPTLVMQGRQVYSWVRTRVAEEIRGLLRDSGATVDDLAAFVPHQANGRIIDMLVEQLELPGHVVVARDIERSGNTSAAAVPLALDGLRDDPALRSGDLALLFGFGAGLAYAGQLIALP